MFAQQVYFKLLYFGVVWFLVCLEVNKNLCSLTHTLVVLPPPIPPPASNNRKKRAMPDDLASPETVSAWTEVSSNTLHKTSPKGITCLDLHPSKPNLVSAYLHCVVLLLLLLLPWS